MQFDKESGLNTVSNVVEHVTTHVGQKERRQAKQTTAALAGAALVDAGGTIEWEGPKRCAFGYESLWEYIAGTHHPDAQGARPRQRAEVATLHAHEYREGFTALAEHLLREGVTLMRLPASTGGKALQCVTIDPEYQVNGESAAPAFARRETRRAAGQTRTAMAKLQPMVGEDVAKRLVLEAAIEGVQKALPNPN